VPHSEIALVITIVKKETLAIAANWNGWIRFCNGRVLHKMRLGTYGF